MGNVTSQLVVCPKNAKPWILPLESAQPENAQRLRTWWLLVRLLLAQPQPQHLTNPPRLFARSLLLPLLRQGPGARGQGTHDEDHFLHGYYLFPSPDKFKETRD